MWGLPCNDAVRLETGKQESVHEFLERHAELQAQGNGDGETVRHAAESSPFLVHVEEDFTESAILILAGAQVNVVAADAGFLRVTSPPVGQAAAMGDVAIDDLLGDTHRFGLGGGHGWLVNIGNGIERLAELGPVPVEGVGLEHELPAQQVSLLDILNGRLMRHVDGLGQRPADEGLRCGHHADVRLGRQVTLAGLAAPVGTIEHRIMFGPQMRRPLDGHGAADVGVGFGDLLRA